MGLEIRPQLYRLRPVTASNSRVRNKRPSAKVSACGTKRVVATSLVPLAVTTTAVGRRCYIYRRVRVLILRLSEVYTFRAACWTILGLAQQSCMDYLR